MTITRILSLAAALTTALALAGTAALPTPAGVQALMLPTGPVTSMCRCLVQS